MQLQLAIGTVAVLILNFGLDRLFRHLCRKTQAAEPQAGVSTSAHNLAALKTRDRRLGWLALAALIALLSLQSLNIANAIHKQKDQNMDNIEMRLEKIEKFLWGDGGSHTSTEPVKPPGGPSHAESIESKIAELTKEVGTLRKDLTDVYFHMKIPQPA